MTTLECLGATHGDCLVLHHGAVKVLFDGGPAGVYNQFLKKWIAANKPAGGPLNFDLGMVTHIDDDHINGLLALVKGEFGRACLVRSLVRHGRKIGTVWQWLDQGLRCRQCNRPKIRVIRR